MVYLCVEVDVLSHFHSDYHEIPSPSLIHYIKEYSLYFKLKQFKRKSYEFCKILSVLAQTVSSSRMMPSSFLQIFESPILPYTSSSYI